MKTKLYKNFKVTKLPKKFKEELKKHPNYKYQIFRDNYTRFILSILNNEPVKRWTALTVYTKWPKLFDLFNPEQQEEIQFMANDALGSI